MYGRMSDVSYTSSGGTSFQYEGIRFTPSAGNNELTHVHNGGLYHPATYKETGLDAFAQQAYNRSAPTAVVFDAGQFLGELREGLPRLSADVIRHQAGILKSAGSDYLNVEFGWKPFISDLQNAARALNGAVINYSQMGKRVHRRYSLPETTQEELGGYTNAASILSVWNPGFALHYPQPTGFPTGLVSGPDVPSWYTVKKTRRSRRWFEGEFTNFLPLGLDTHDYMQRLSVLIDPRITAATLWELAPWSWLVDWNLRVGDTIRANEINANDRLVMHYGYAMEHTVYETRVDWEQTREPSTTYFKYGNRPKFGVYRAQTEYKRRLRANPYGFRVGGIGGLTGQQAGILGALGLTKFK